MKWTKKRRKDHEIELDYIVEGMMSPRMKITIDGYSTTISLTSEQISDMKWQTPNWKEYIDNMIDEEIERHPNFNRNIRRLKLLKLKK